MRSIIQRVRNASVVINGEEKRFIGRGLVVLLGVCSGDSRKDVDYIINKILGLRVFPDQNGKMNYSVVDIKGEILVISQFTLCAETRKGKRPDFTNAAKPEDAEYLYKTFVDELRRSGLNVQTGTFAADMLVEIFNEGPVTLVIDTPK